MERDFCLAACGLLLVLMADHPAGGRGAARMNRRQRDHKLGDVVVFSEAVLACSSANA